MLAWHALDTVLLSWLIADGAAWILSLSVALDASLGFEVNPMLGTMKIINNDIFNQRIVNRAT